MYRNDTPTRYTYMGQLWREEYPDAYQAYREELRAKQEAKRKMEAEEKSVVDLMMDDMFRGHIGFEPTEDSQ